MKILFALFSPIPNPNAAWTRVAFFAEYFSDRGHDVTVAGAFSASSFTKAGSINWKGITILNLTPIIRMSNIFSLIFNIVSSIITSILPILLTRPELIIISVPPGETAFGCFKVAKLFRIKKIIIDYRDEWEDAIISISQSPLYRRSYGYLKTLMTKCYRRSDLVITVTESMGNSLLLRGIKKIKVATNGADSNIFKPYPKNDSRKKKGFNSDDFIIVYSGGFHVYYRLDIVLRAIKRVASKRHDVKLLLLGYGSNIKEILKLSKELGLGDCVFYLGAKLDKSELAELLSASDLGVVPYDSNPIWKTTIPAKALEYFACGLPVVATAYQDSAVGRLISDNKIGLLSAPEDEYSLAENIERMYEDRALVTDAGKKAASLIKEHFDRNKIAEELLSMLVSDTHNGKATL